MSNRISLSFILLLALVVISRTSVRAQTSTPPVTPESTEGARPAFDGAKAFEDLAAQMAFGARPTGSAAWVKTGDYILSTLKDYGWKTQEQPFDLNVNGALIRGRNLIGSLGSGPVIIIGAHYDTRLWADDDPDPAKRHDPVMGADDGASGVAVMLELARVLAKGYTFNREIRLVFLDAEDNGEIPGWNDWSLGTTYYVDHLDVAPEYVVILDMIGDADLNIYYEGESMRSAPEIVHGIWDTAAALGYSQSFIPSLKYTMIDDHVPFISAGFKAIDIIDYDYPYHHTTSDTLDKVSAQSLERVGRTMQTYLVKTAAVQ